MTLKAKDPSPDQKMPIEVMALAGTTAQLCVSGDVYAEYEEVIRRPKFNRTEMIVDHALRGIRQNGLWVKPSEKVQPVPILTTTFSWGAPRPHVPTT